MAVTLKMYSRGIALDNIVPGKEGRVFFVEHGEVSCKAITEVRAGSEVIVIDGHKGIREASPYELKFERYIGLAGQTGLFSRATEEHRYPVVDSGVKDDSARLNTAAAPGTHYVVGANAYAADPSVPWGQTFTASRVSVLCNQNAWIRFNAGSRVLHFIPANIPTVFPFKITEFWLLTDVVAGVADVWMFG